METQVGDWILYRSGPVMKVSVVRYLLKDEPFSLGETYYQTDEARVRRSDIHEVRRDTTDLVAACEKLGPWMAAATGDEKSCSEFKSDAEVFLEAILPYLPEHVCDFRDGLDDCKACVSEQINVVAPVSAKDVCASPSPNDWISAILSCVSRISDYDLRRIEVEAWRISGNPERRFSWEGKE